MTHISDLLIRCERYALEHGVAELSRVSGVPYTTLREMQERGWSSRSTEILEALEQALSAHNAGQYTEGQADQPQTPETGNSSNFSAGGE